MPRQSPRGHADAREAVRLGSALNEEELQRSCDAAAAMSAPSPTAALGPAEPHLPPASPSGRLSASRGRGGGHGSGSRSRPCELTAAAAAISERNAGGFVRLLDEQIGEWQTGGGGGAGGSGGGRGGSATKRQRSSPRGGGTPGSSGGSGGSGGSNGSGGSDRAAWLVVDMLEELERTDTFDDDHDRGGDGTAGAGAAAGGGHMLFVTSLVGTGIMAR